MKDTDPRFDLSVRTLVAWGKMDPMFEETVWNATTDFQIDALVEEAREQLKAHATAPATAWDQDPQFAPAVSRAEAKRILIEWHVAEVAASEDRPRFNHPNTGQPLT